jgi:uracil-DNA glycosylase family 4
MTRPVDALLDFLRSQERRGVSHVYLDDDVRQALRDLHQRARGKTPARQARASQAAPAEPPVAPAAEVPVIPVMPQATGDAAAQIAALASAAASWPPILALGTLRDTLVFSAGNPEARVMLIGEAPTHHDERSGEPFSGPAGDKLTAILKAMGLPRTEVYLSNIVKFRPAIPNQTINSRKPTAAELAACLPLLHEEIRIVAPEVIIALGGTAAETLLGIQASVDSLSGSWQQFQGIPLRATFHPSELLHGDEALGIKRRLWEDMLAVMERLGMPVSAKQRGFFQKP